MVHGGSVFLYGLFHFPTLELMGVFDSPHATSDTRSGLMELFFVLGCAKTRRARTF